MLQEQNRQNYFTVWILDGILVTSCCVHAVKNCDATAIVSFFSSFILPFKFYVSCWNFHNNIIYSRSLCQVLVHVFLNVRSKLQFKWQKYRSACKNWNPNAFPWTISSFEEKICKIYLKIRLIFYGIFY